MGTSEAERRRLQGIKMTGHLKWANFLVVISLCFIANAHAQIIPFHGTLEYSAATGTWPKLMVKAANGSAAYVLTLQDYKDITGMLSHIDLVMRRPRDRQKYSNLLEPPYRWHGLQDYDFNAIDFKDGPEHSIMGRRGISA